jgi:hypothetical protein
MWVKGHAFEEPAVVCDVSHGGLCLQGRSSAKVGQQISVTLTADGRDWTPMLCRVAWARDDTSSPRMGLSIVDRRVSVMEPALHLISDESAQPLSAAQG